MLFYYKLTDMGGAKRGAGAGGTCSPCLCSPFAFPKNIDGDKVHSGNQTHAKV